MTSLLIIMMTAIGATAGTGASFQRVAGGPALDRGVFVSPVSDGGYIVAGVTKNTEAGDEDILLARFDAAGEPLWSRMHGGPETDNGWSVHEVGDGFAVAGYTNSSGAGGFDFYLLMTDAQGEMQWSKTYGGEADDRCWALLPTADGGFALAGETFSSGAGAEDFLLVKTGPTGAEEWSRTYGGEAGDRCFGVAPAGDTGFVLAGQTYSSGAGERDAYLIQTDADGNEEWSRVLGGGKRDVAHSVSPTADGGFLVTGYTASFARSGYAPWLIRIDTRGDTLWTRTLPIGGSRTITGEQAADGGFLLVGFTQDPAAGTAALLVRTDGDGQLEWTRNFFSTTSGQSFGYTLRATDDGGCIFTGHTTVGSAGDLDLFIVKADTLGR